MENLNLRNQKNIFYKIFTLLIIFYPVLETYGSPIKSMGLGMFVFIPFIPYVFLDLYNKKIKIHTYLFFYLYSIIITLIIFILLGKQAISYRLFFHTLGLIIAIICACEYFDVTLGLKIYKILVLVASIFLIVQYISFVYFGHVIPWVLKFFPLQYGISNANEYLNLLITQYYQGGFRPTSFFLEPAYFAEFVLPLFTIILFNIQNKRDIFLLFYIFISIIISGSAGGFAYLFIMLLIWTLYKGQKIIRKLNIIKLFIVLGIILLVIVFFSKVFDLFITTNVVIRKINEFLNGSVNASGNIRILRGFLIFNQLDIIHQIFGVGFSNYAYIFEKFNITTLFDIGVGDNVSYMCTIAHILVSTGIIGFGLFLAAFVEFFKYGIKSCKALIILFFMICMSSSILYKQTYILCLVFIVTLKNNIRNEE